ncbi:sensor histidine kinase [Paenibacillus sanguinis]|uniref:sensor histidine kinase n=1 Tax=Paenibacillus sanguinis TaxID=225906 RepID=UPI0003700057|nr:sensor histidine kinase [Paenibacillus sanguinis]
MEWFILNLLYSSIIPVLLYFNFCRFCDVKFRWYGALLYAVISSALVNCNAVVGLGEITNVVLGILLLSVCGALFHKCRFIESFTLSSLVISINSIVDGIMQSFIHWILSLINAKFVLMYADFARYTLVILLLLFTFRIAKKTFSDSVKNMRLSMLLVLITPILFITLVEAVVSDSIYGNTVIWNTETGLVSPIVNNMQMLLLRLFAYGGLFSILTVYKKMTVSIEHEQTIRLLEQQTQNQEVYVREAKLRYEQTRSFRHDIKNHLLVLHQLIKGEKTNEAEEYLRNMEVVSNSLSFQVQTRNGAVDALLSSKLDIATQKGIPTHCTIRIPQPSSIADMDWCIVLSNALDNAISASEDVASQDRWIYLSGKQKGNAYLLNIENCCLQYTKLPLEGIGLSNIRAVLKKYNGKMEIEISDNIFKLNILFIIPQHSKDIPQQTC